MVEAGKDQGDDGGHYTSKYVVEHDAQRRMQPVGPADRGRLDDIEEAEPIDAKLIELAQDWVPSAPGATLYIRPAMFATEPFLGVHASTSYIHFVIAGPVGAYFKEGFNPVPVFISDKYRRAVRGGVGAAKTGGNYAASLYATAEANQQGYTQVLWLDAIEHRWVEEVGTMNIFFRIKEAMEAGEKSMPTHSCPSAARRLV